MIKEIRQLKKVICSKCKKEIPKQPEGSCTTGYGINDKDEKVCYACCAEDDKQYMRDHDRTTLYFCIINTCKAKITNWPGSLEFDNISYTTGKHNIASVRYDCWFWFEGVEWWGVCYGDNTQILHCRKLQAK